MLTLPIIFEQPWLALLVYIGGLSAATGMVIVETIALSTMVSNDLVLPALLRRWRRRPPAADLGRLLLTIRRGAIVVILLLGFLYYWLAGEAYALVGIGLISFVAVAQFAPAVIGGLYWRGGTREGALAGLSAGFLVWIYTLLLPSFAKSGWLPPAFMESGLGGLDLLAPMALFGLAGWNEITHGLFWSLTANIGAFLLVSSLRAPNAAEASQAGIFVDASRRTALASAPLWRGSAEIAELMSTGRALPRIGAHPRGLRRSTPDRADVDSPDALPADAETVYFAETLLSGAIGGASARVMVASVTDEEPLGLDEVLNILDEASQIRAYSRQLEQKSQALEAATEELRAANIRLQDLDRMKDDFISSVTHELRTPLASIRAFSEILFDDPDIDVEQRRRFLGILVSETERLSRLVNQVLDLAKIESGHADWRTEVVELADGHPPSGVGHRAICRGARLPRPSRSARRVRDGLGRPRPHRAGPGEPALERRQIRPDRIGRGLDRLSPPPPVGGSVSRTTVTASPRATWSWSSRSSIRPPAAAPNPAGPDWVCPSAVESSTI
jgi:hypothetical protein